VVRSGCPEMVSVSEILNPVSQLFITVTANILATDFDTGSQKPFVIILQSSAQLQFKKRAHEPEGKHGTDSGFLRNC
jgi:hypothetical protein